MFHLLPCVRCAKKLTPHYRTLFLGNQVFSLADLAALPDSITAAITPQNFREVSTKGDVVKESVRSGG